MNDVLTIERLPEETPKAYQARVEYIVAGPSRSLDKLRQKYARNTSYKRQLQVWSSRYDWVECARKYDEAAAHLVTQKATDDYLAALADYRKRYSDMGKGLWQAAAVLTRRLATEAASMDIGPGTLALAANAARTAADLEALALRIEHVLNDEPRSE